MSKEGAHERKESKLNIQNPIRNKYVCPEEGCNLIPEIIKTTDLGKIVLSCGNNHKKIMDIEDYLKKIDEKKKKKNFNPKESKNVPKNNSNNDDFENSKETLTEKSKDLSNIIKTHIKILDLQEKKKDNYFHNQNVINLGNFLEKEKDNYYISSVDTENPLKTIDDIIKEELEDKKKEEDEALEKLKNNYFVDLEKYLRTNDEKELKEGLNLKLKGPKEEKKYIKYLRDDGFALISKLRFKNLKEINLANNKITNLNPLNNMLLPHLEIIIFSDNEIKVITPLANLLSKNLLEIYLQNNQIEDLGPFIISDFPLLEIFRVDGKGNEKAFDKKSFNAVKKKYKNVIYYEPKDWTDFKKEYEYNWDINKDYQELDKLELGSRRDEKILRDLYPLITYPNKITSLILDDNKLQDASLLSKMPLYNLKFLDLSVNFIINIKFFKKMAKRCKNLKTLYLNDNKINDISPLVKYDENNDVDLIFGLDALTLKNNYLDLKDKTTRDILVKLINSNDDKESNFTFDYEKKDLNENNNNNNNNNINDNNDNTGIQQIVGVNGNDSN